MREYFERFPLVETQQTFYEPPGERTLLRWRESAPPEFEFTVKAWQLITHTANNSTYRRLRRPLTGEERATTGAFRDSAIVASAWSATLRCAMILRATSVLFQCPASFRPTDEHTGAMRRFFSKTPRHGLVFVWEPRGPWPPELVHQLCNDLDLVHAVDPFVNDNVTPERIYYRLHGNGGSRHVYTDDELRFIASRVRDSRDACVLFNNLPRETDAARFQHLIAGARPAPADPERSPVDSEGNATH